MMADLLDKDFQTYDQYQALNKNFIEQNQVSVLLQRDGGFRNQHHRHLIDWVTRVFRKNSDIARVYSSYGMKKGYEENGSFQIRPILIPNYGVDYSNEELKDQYEQLAKTPAGHILVNKEKNDIFASFYLENLSKEEKSLYGHFNTKAYESLVQSFKDFVKKKFPDIKATWIGIGTYQYFLQKAYEQMNIVNLITGLFLILGFKLFFGLWRTGFILLATYNFSLILLYGFMGGMHFPVDSLSAAVPIMLLISTLEDFVFFLIVHKKKRDIKQSFEAILLPSFYTSLTTVFGFLSLYLSELSIIQRFGLICAVGAVLEWLIVFLVLPKVLVLWEKRKGKSLSLGSIPQGINSFLLKVKEPKIPQWLGFILLAPLIMFVFYINTDLRIEDSPEAVFPDKHPIRESTQKLIESRGWKSEISLVFPYTLERKKNEGIFQKIVNDVPEIIAYESFYKTRNYVESSLKDSVHQYYVREFFGESFSASRWISNNSTHERGFLYSNTSDVVRISEIRKYVSKLCGEKCYLANILISYSEFGIKVLRTLTKSFSLSLVLIVFLIFVLAKFFKIKQWPIILLTALWGPLTLISLMIVLDIGIYFATSVVMSVLVGLAGDNALQFLFHENSSSVKDGLNELSLASILCTILMTVCCIAFLFSDFDGVRKIGIMMICGFVLGWIGDVVILRSLLNLKKT